jgi:hypothetical protein
MNSPVCRVVLGYSSAFRQSQFTYRRIVRRNTKEKEMNKKFNPTTLPVLIAVAIGYAVSEAWDWLRR